jgi:hypothetical protein
MLLVGKHSPIISGWISSHPLRLRCCWSFCWRDCEKMRLRRWRRSWSRFRWVFRGFWRRSCGLRRILLRSFTWGKALCCWRNIPSMWGALKWLILSKSFRIFERCIWIAQLLYKMAFREGLFKCIFKLFMTYYISSFFGGIRVVLLLWLLCDAWIL